MLKNKVFMEKITDLSQLDPNGLYSYADYLTWQLYAFGVFAP